MTRGPLLCLAIALLLSGAAGAQAQGPVPSDPDDAIAQEVAPPARAPLELTQPLSWLDYTATSSLVGAAAAATVAGALSFIPFATFVGGYALQVTGNPSQSGPVLAGSAAMFLLGLPVVCSLITTGAVAGAAVADGIWPGIAALAGAVPGFVVGALGTTSAFVGLASSLLAAFAALDQGGAPDPATLWLGTGLLYGGGAAMVAAPVLCGAGAVLAATLSSSEEASAFSVPNRE